MADKLVTDARERFEYGRDFMAEQHARMREDFEFSNPADPQQWPADLRNQRESDPYGRRPCLTLDRTNTNISSVVNDARKNKPATKVRPVDSRADIKVAEALDGLIRHIEDGSRAGIANDTSIDHSARCGLGWQRIVTEVVDEASNLQEIKIKRIVDPFSVILDPESQEPDGCDSMWGQVATKVNAKTFKRAYPKASLTGWPDDLTTGTIQWLDDKTVLMMEDFVVSESSVLCIVITGTDGQPWELTEEDYAQLVQSSGMQPPILRQYKKRVRAVKWRKLNAMEVLEETDFPASYVPLIPVIGDEVWLDGKRYLSGLIRRMADGQRLYNYERSSYVENVALQSKAPWVGDPRSISGFEDHWKAANKSNIPFLPARAEDENGRPLPQPQRQSPPPLPSAYVQGAQMALDDIRGSVGIWESDIGAPSQERSGRAILAKQAAGDTANFHYADNLARAIEHRSRIILQMIPRVYDTERVARILGDDGQQSSVRIVPDMPSAGQYEGKKLLAMNPAVGKYDVTVSVGPSFESRRQEQVAAMSELVNGNPQMMALIGDEFVKAQDWQNADKISQRLRLMLPPEVRESEQSDDQVDIPPEVQAQMQQAQQMIDQLTGALNEAQAKMEELQRGDALKAAEFQLKERELSLKERDTEGRLLLDAARLEREQMQPTAAPEAPEAPEQEGDDNGGAVAVLAAQVAELKAMLAMALQSQAMPREAMNLTIPVNIDASKGASVKQARITRGQDGSYLMEAAEAPVN